MGQLEAGLLLENYQIIKEYRKNYIYFFVYDFLLMIILQLLNR